MAPFIRGVSDFRSPPYRFDNFTSTTLTVPACQSKLQAVCDKYLNGPLKRTSPNVFVATTPTILLTFCRFRQAESIPEVSIGYLNYQEVSVVFGVKDIKHNEHFMYGWVLVLDGPEANTAEYFASPPVVTGRELFGLPKLRGEISFDPDLLTGELRCVYPSASKIVMKLDLCIRVEHPLQCQIRRILDELLIIEEQQGQTRSLEKLTPEEHRNQLVEQHRALTRELEKLRQRRPFGKRHHPLALAYKFFGNDVTSIIRSRRDLLDLE